jgi:putative sugar O-methyltransferase
MISVSIGMPVYNGAKTIASALNTLLAQTMADFELIISDNGSTDATESICLRYAQSDPRIRYVRQPTNLGAAMNFRYVLFAAKAEFFMWAAADDLWSPVFVQTHLTALERDPQAVGSQSQVLFCKADVPSHLSTGTYSLTGNEEQNLARFLTNPADNSRFYGLFRTQALRNAYPARNFHALDWGVSAATLHYGTHLEIQQVLMIRDNSDATAYENAVRRDHRFILWRLFPALYLTRWLLLNRRIPAKASILLPLLQLNIYLHFRFGMYRIGWLADMYLAPGGRPSLLHRMVQAVVRPRLSSRLRKALAMALRPLRRLARAGWRRLPLTLPQRESVKSRMVGMFGKTALRVAGTTDYALIASGGAAPLAPDPRARGLQEDIWRLPSTSQPGEAALSVVLVVQGGIADTLQCIDALQAGQALVQIVVVDNASTDVTPLALAGVKGLAMHRYASPVSFAEALQAGLALATAPAVAVLDAGVIPADDFATEVLRGLQVSPIVVPQVRNRAGFVVGMGGGNSNNAGFALGVPLPPRHPLCCARQPVDYAQVAFACTGTAREILADIGDGTSIASVSLRLTERLANAACYYPDAAVYCLADGVPALAPEEYAKGEGVAARHHPSHLMLEPTVLYIDAETPMPDQNSGSIDAMNLMRMLLHFGFRVLFVPESNFAHRGKYTERLFELGVTALYATYFTSVRQVLEQFGRDLSLVVLCRAYIADKYIALVRELAPQARIVFNTVDLNFLRDQRAAALSGDPVALAAAEAQRDAEFNSIAAADGTIVLSRYERQLLATVLPKARVHLIPLIRDIPERLDVPGFADRRDLMFVGTYQHPPNEDAVVTFVNEVWPLIRRRLPEVHFFVVGSSVTPKVQALAGNGVEVLGLVEDLDSLLAKCRLTVAPLRFGAGLKGKLASALQAGVPTVASPIAVEGSGLVDGEEVLVADTPQQWADAVVRLYQDQPLWEALSRAGFAFVHREYSIEANSSRLADLLDAVGVSTFSTEIESLKAEMRAAAPQYRPSAYWEMLGNFNLGQIRSHGLARFKRTINNNYFQFLPGDVTDPQVTRLLAFLAAQPSHWPIEAACNADRHASTTQVTTAFNYNPFSNPEYIRFYSFFVGLLWYFACCHDGDRLHETLAEPELGAPISVEVGGKLISQDLANSLHEWGRIRQLVQGVPMRSRPLLLEIGGGYGRLAHVVIHAGRFRYAVVDIAPALIVAKWYLTSLYPALRVFGFRHFDRYEDVAAEIEAADICFFSSNQLEILPDGFAEVGVAISSLHEMKADQIQNYLNLLATKTRDAVYMKNWTSWRNPSDDIVVDRDSFRLPGLWQLVLDEAHPINSEMWETGYLRPDAS